MACRFQLLFLLLTQSCFPDAPSSCHSLWLWWLTLWRQYVRHMKETVAWVVHQEECFFLKGLGVCKVHPQVVYRNPDHVLCNRAVGWVVVVIFEPVVPNSSFSYSSSLRACYSRVILFYFIFWTHAMLLLCKSPHFGSDAYYAPGTFPGHEGA